MDGSEMLTKLFKLMAQLLSPPPKHHNRKYKLRKKFTSTYAIINQRLTDLRDNLPDDDDDDQPETA